jgi:hypothetical protein
MDFNTIIDELAVSYSMTVNEHLWRNCWPSSRPQSGKGPEF